MYTGGPAVAHRLKAPGLGGLVRFGCRRSRFRSRMSPSSPSVSSEEDGGPVGTSAVGHLAAQTASFSGDPS